MESCEGVGTHKRSCPDLKHQPVVRMPSPDLREVRVGTHKRSCPDLKHLTMLGTLSPDLNVARVPSQRPHKRSAASLKHCRSSKVLTASPTEVRAQIGR